MIAKLTDGDLADSIAKQRRHDTDIGDCDIAYLSLREQTKAEESKQRTIGVADNGIDCIDETLRVDSMEQHDEKGEETADDDVADASQTLVMLILTDVDTETGGERREG